MNIFFYDLKIFYDDYIKRFRFNEITELKDFIKMNYKLKVLTSKLNYTTVGFDLLISNKN